MKTTEFIALLKPGSDLVEKMDNAKSPEDAYAIAKAEGVTDDFDTFVEEMKKLREAVAELSDDDLEAVAGGATSTEIVSAVSTTVAAAATAASAAAV